jgi:hypothetical protein
MRNTVSTAAIFSRAAALFFLVAALSSALGGCAETAGEGCPPLVSYSPAAQKRGAHELDGLAGDSQVARMIVDYGKMRDACRSAGVVHPSFRAARR